MSPRVGLDRETVVQAAVELVNQEGVEALSLNRLASKLKVQTPSLYNHISGLPGLYRELALRNARNLSERFTAAAVGKSGPDALFQLGETYRAYIKENAGLYLASLRASRNQEPFDSELAELEGRVVDVVARVLGSFGIQGEEAIHAVRGLRSLVHGFATLEIAGGFGLPVSCDKSFNHLIGQFIQGIQQSSASGSRNHD